MSERVRLYDLLWDPVAGKPSSARLIGLLMGLASIGFAFAHPAESVTLGVLVGAMLVSLGLRKSPAEVPE